MVPGMTRRVALLAGASTVALVATAPKRSFASEALAEEASRESDKDGISEYWQLIDRSFEPVSDLNYDRAGIDLPKREKPLTFTRDTAASYWANYKDRASADLTITERNALDAPLRPLFQKIEAGFRFAEHPDDTNFFKFHVEALLDQAAHLFDRGLTTRRLHDEDLAQYLELCLELGEYFELDDIHTEEESAGFYDHQGEASRAEHRAVVNEETQKRQLHDHLHTARGLWSDSAKAGLTHYEKLGAWASGQEPYYRFGDKEPHNIKHPKPKPSFDRAQLVGNHMLTAAEARSLHNLSKQQHTFEVQMRGYGYEADIAGTRKDGLRSTAEWRTKEGNFNRRRTLTTRKYRDLKARAVYDEEGALNYSKYLSATRERFHQDFRDGVARLLAAQNGMREIYGYDAPFPETAGKLTYFDDCLLWTRQAIQWLVRFSRKDQSIVLPIPLRAALGEGEWANLLRGKVAYFHLPYRQYFEGMSRIRLRGLNMFSVDTQSPPTTYRFRIRPPKRGIIVASHDNQLAIDQGSVPAITLANVTNRSPHKVHESFGVTALNNVSPLGAESNWALRLLAPLPSAQTGSLKPPDDLVLDLRLSYQDISNGEI